FGPLPLPHAPHSVALRGTATQGDKIGGSARGQDTHDMLAAFSRFATGRAARKRKKRGKL
ncbi:MAG: hypothetical protein LBP52_08040, partial [Burkholderiaceae bacterium]|nr:hypothetical protein [Burkholderiaceae bacterium]